MRTAFFRLHLSVFLAGFTGILGRLISLNEGLLVWYRLLISSLTIWLLFGLGGKLKRLPAKQVLQITGVGFIAALHWVSFYGAIKYANVSLALVCFSAIGFFTAIIEPLLLRRRPDLIEIALGLLVITGIYIIFHFDTGYKAGLIFGMVSALLAGLFPVLNRQLLKTVSVETLITYELSGGLLTLSLFLPVYLKYFPAEKLLPDLSDLGWLLVLSWACTVWAFRLSAYALKHISAFTVNLSFNLEPVYGILLAFLLFKENKYLGGHFYVGLSLIILAVALQMWRVYTSRGK